MNIGRLLARLLCVALVVRDVVGLWIWVAGLLEPLLRFVDVVELRVWSVVEIRIFVPDVAGLWIGLAVVPLRRCALWHMPH